MLTPKSTNHSYLQVKKVSYFVKSPFETCITMPYFSIFVFGTSFLVLRIP